jgi:hypothetical protein
VNTLKEHDVTNSKFEALNSKQIPISKFKNRDDILNFNICVLILFSISDFEIRI